MSLKRAGSWPLALRVASWLAPVMTAMLILAGCSHKEEIARLKAEASQAEATGDHQKAIARWSSVLKLNRKNGEAWLKRAALHETLGQWPEAIADYTEYLKLPPWRPGFKEQLAIKLGQDLSVTPEDQTAGWFVLCQRAFVYAKLGQFDKSELDLSEAVRLQPQSAVVRVSRAQTLQLKGDADAALQALDEAVKVAPQDATGYAYRGAYFMSRGKPRDAMPDLDKALQLEPLNTRALLHRGIAWSLQGHLDEALDDLDQAVKTSPEEPDAHAYRGAVLLQAGKYDDAFDDLNTALALRPNDPKVLAQRGLAQTQKGNLALGLADFDQAIRLNPAEPHFYAWRANALNETNQLDKALEDLNHAIAMNPREPSFYRVRGRTYTKQHKYREALADMEHSRELNPDSMDSCNSLAWLRATCPDASVRNGAEAVKLATQACESTRFGLWAALDTLAAAYAEAGDFDQAVRYQKQALGSVGIREKKRAEMQRRLTLYEQKKPFREEL